MAPPWLLLAWEEVQVGRLWSLQGKWEEPTGPILGDTDVLVKYKDLTSEDTPGCTGERCRGLLTSAHSTESRNPHTAEESWPQHTAFKGSTRLLEMRATQKAEAGKLGARVSSRSTWETL